MADILHTVTMRARPDEVFRALTASSGLRPGWARQSDAGATAGSLSEFRFGDDTIVHMRVDALSAEARVAWTCVDGPPDWVGTQVSFELLPDGDETIVRFRHKDWRAPSDFMGRCSAKWARVLFALKSLLETPDAEDVY